MHQTLLGYSMDSASTIGKCALEQAVIICHLVNLTQLQLSQHPTLH